MALLVHAKLSRMPNSGFAQIWLQRMLKMDLKHFEFSEKICNLQIIDKEKIILWNNSWIKGKNMLNILNNTLIFQQDEFNKLDSIISNDEIDIFDY